MAICLWGTKIVSDMQWPCPDGFHVPLRSEWTGLRARLISDLELAENATTLQTYLKMPMAWDRDNSDGNSIYQQWKIGYYWSSTVYGNIDTASYIYFTSSAFTYTYNRRSFWFSIRAFKDTPVEPDNSWTVLYQWTWKRWVYYNSTLWLISISWDWSTRYTIADKNLWATTVYNSWDTLSEANCGKYFQWGNNYGFPWTWTITTSSTVVDASSYWPWNYYSSDTFINSSNWRWTTTDNRNLRWWVSQWTSEKKVEPKKIYYWDSIIVSDMQGPCPDGFHVPSYNEFNYFLDAWRTLWASWNTLYKVCFKMPYNWERIYTDWSIADTNNYGYYWTSSAGSNHKAYHYSFNGTYLYSTDIFNSYWFAIRWIKDSPVVPTSSWTKLYWTSIESWWVFWSSADWLISVSSNWSTWYTIMDKNLWATQVYNNWDTLSEANCWKFYQRWNNYWFPRSWSITTSSTQVNASTYWPWNYYESSTFIARSSSPYWWDSSINKNLRWWVTQWTSEKATEVKAVYLWEVKVRPTFKPKTFTISWIEQSNMSSWWTYSDDATWLTAWDTAFDEFFWYYGCRLNTSWQETATITQEQSWWAWKLDITQLGTLTSGDNVMIAFPVRWIKMTKSWSTVTLSITDWLGRESEWYQYYAHSRWTFDNPVAKDIFYLWAFEAGLSWSVMKSWSWGIMTSTNTWTAITRARANDGNDGSAWYDIVWFYQREFVNALYMMKYGNPNSQSVVWQWYTSWNPRTAWWTTSQTDATYWTSSTSQQMKLFWLEDWWGNVQELLWGACTDGSKVLYTALSGFVWNVKTSSPYASTWTTVQHSWSYYDMSSIAWNNKAMFMPTSTVNNSNFNSYYCDNVYVAGSRIATVGGSTNGTASWIFNIVLNYTTSGWGSNVWTRLMYL